jgi:hypothetical protein
LHAYVTLAKLGDSAWAGVTEAAATTRLLVCVLKSHTPPDTYVALASRTAGWRGALECPGITPEH